MADHTPAHVKEAGFSLGWGKLAGRLWGPADGVPMIALHGWLDNAASFDRLLPHFPEFQVLALDLSGHGLSEHRPSYAMYQFVEVLQDLEAVRKQLGWERCHWLGHSLGGIIAGIYAAVFPDHVLRLAMLEALGPLPLPAKETVASRMRRYCDAAEVLSQKRLPVYPSPTMAGAARQTAGPLSDAAVACLLTRALKDVPGGGVTWRSDPRLRLPTAIPLAETQVLALLSALTCPTWVLRARPGLIGEDNGWWQSRSEAIAQLTTHRVAGGHHVHLDAPELLVKELRAFLLASS